MGVLVSMLRGKQVGMALTHRMNEGIELGLTARLISSLVRSKCTPVGQADYDM